MHETTIRYGTLETVPVDRLYAAFLDAFSDYAVPITATMEDFLAMHARRGVSYRSSVGAFEGERLVGFIFNGLGKWGGKRCAYDAGTGIVPSHRGAGLSKALAAEAIERLRRGGFGLWLLEVLVGNDKAIRTYEGAGFRVTRVFHCPEGSIPDASSRAGAAALGAGVVIKPLASFDPRALAAFRDWEPSWQNSDDSMARTRERLIALGAYAPPGNDVLAGYIVATGKGSISQLAVSPSFRRGGIGRALLLSLAAETAESKVRYVNVDGRDEATMASLASLGVTSAIDQLEMILEL